MLKVFLYCNNHPAVFDLPHSPLAIGDYLLTAGHWNPYTDLYLTDNAGPDQVQVKLIPETAADIYLLSLFSDDAQLSTVNTVCELFSRLPAERQTELINSIAMGQISKEKDLLDAIKTMKSAETYTPSIVFSRVKLWTDTGEDCEFFMSGVPVDNDDFEEHDDFESFVEQISTSDTKKITAYITTFSEGDGEQQPASQADIERINNAIADVDIDTITGWNKIGENQFSFDYDIDELFNMKGIE